MLEVAGKEIPCMRGLIKVNDARATLRFAVPIASSVIFFMLVIPSSRLLLHAALKIYPLNFDKCSMFMTKTRGLWKGNWLFRVDCSKTWNFRISIRYRDSTFNLEREYWNIEKPISAFCSTSANLPGQNLQHSSATLICSLGGHGSGGHLVSVSNRWQVKLPSKQSHSTHCFGETFSPWS